MMQNSDFLNSEAQLLRSVRHELSPENQRVMSFLLPLSDDYPEIDQWFMSKVVPGITTGSRKIATYERDGKLVAVGIAKKEFSEKKICTVRVDQSFFGRGLGVRIFKELMQWLDDEKPILTVSDEKMPEFQRLFDHFGFACTSATPNLYRQGSTELGFNEANRNRTNLN